MKELDFDGIVIEDFKEFHGEHSIDLRKLGLGVHFVSGINLVDKRLGSNGAGKSSIWDALCWCLFGRTVSGLRGTDLRTWDSKAHAVVRVALRIDGVKHAIARSTKTNGLWIDQKVCEQAAVDELLGLSYATFPHAILLGQSEPLFFDLKPTEKMALLSETLNLDRWDDRSKAARKSVDGIDSEWSQMKGRHAELLNTATDADKKVDELEGFAANWDEAEAGKAKSNEKTLTEARKALAFAATTMGNHDLALDSAETEAKAMRGKIAAKNAEIVEFASAIGGGSAAISALVQQLADIDQEANAVGDNCPTCGQSLKGTALAKHRKEAKRKIAALETELETNRDLLRGMTQSRDSAKADAAKLIAYLRGFEEKADDARDGYTRAQAAHAAVAAKIVELEKSTDAAAMQKNPYTDLLKTARSQVRRISKLIEDVDSLLLAIEAKRARVAHWVSGFKNVRLYLLQEVLDELTGVTQTLLPQIGLEGWVIEYAMERETQSGKVLPGLNVNIYKPDRDRPVKWESWSGGEGQRLRLIGAIALSEVILRRAGVVTDLMILDEPTTHLSQEGVSEMVDFLIERGRDYQIFYVDHQAIETSRFARGIHVIKDAAGSRVE